MIKYQLFKFHKEIPHTVKRKISTGIKFSLYLQFDSYQKNIICEIIIATLVHACVRHLRCQHPQKILCLYHCNGAFANIFKQKFPVLRNSITPMDLHLFSSHVLILSPLVLQTRLSPCHYPLPGMEWGTSICDNILVTQLE